MPYRRLTAGRATRVSVASTPTSRHSPPTATRCTTTVGQIELRDADSSRRGRVDVRGGRCVRRAEPRRAVRDGARHEGCSCGRRDPLGRGRSGRAPAQRDVLRHSRARPVGRRDVLQIVRRGRRVLRFIARQPVGLVEQIGDFAEHATAHTLGAPEAALPVNAGVLTSELGRSTTARSPTGPQAGR